MRPRDRNCPGDASACGKSMAEFAPADANQVLSCFSRRHVRREKHCSGCKCRHTVEKTASRRTRGERYCERKPSGLSFTCNQTTFQNVKTFCKVLSARRKCFVDKLRVCPPAADRPCAQHCCFLEKVTFPLFDSFTRPRDSFCPGGALICRGVGPMPVPLYFRPGGMIRRA